MAEAQEPNDVHIVLPADGQTSRVMNSDKWIPNKRRLYSVQVCFWSAILWPLSLSWFTTYAFAVHSSEKWCITLCSACISTRGRFELVSIAAYTRVYETDYEDFACIICLVLAQITNTSEFFTGVQPPISWPVTILLLDNGRISPYCLELYLFTQSMDLKLIFYAAFCFCDLRFSSVVSLCLISQEFKFIF